MSTQDSTTVSEDNEEKKDKEETPEPEDFDGEFAAFHVIAITGSYLGQKSHFNAVQTAKLAATPKQINDNTHRQTHAPHDHIEQFNEYQATKYPKLNASLNKKSSNNLHAAANIWDREYSAFCVAKNIPLRAVRNYASPFIQMHAQDNDENASDENKDQADDSTVDEKATCDVLIKCGGSYAVNSTKTSSFCDGCILNADESLAQMPRLFRLPSLEIARSNCSAIHHEKLGVICYGGRSSKTKQILNRFEVLNIANNDIEWDTNMIPATNESRSRHPSIGLYDDRLLFVCGGRGVCAMKTCEVLNVEYLLKGDESGKSTRKWKQMRSMNFARSFGSNVLNWNKCDSIVVGGGYGQFHAEFHAEQFDINKDIWCAFPRCNFSHKYNPCIQWTKAVDSDNDGTELLFVLCDKRTKSNLGIIEILDVRMKKWMKCKVLPDDLLQLQQKQELRRLLHF